MGRPNKIETEENISGRKFNNTQTNSERLAQNLL